MSSCTYNCFMNVINIGNSIIGVSILAMPYCFRKCGLLLSIALIFLSGILTRIACYLLLKSAIMARRRNFEFLAFHTFGPTGKLAVEVSVIGFLIGVCIAFFVVIGDLGPPLAAEFLVIENSSNLRTNVLMLVGLCVALPLGMLRKIDSLTSLSAISIGFYICLILKIFSEAVPNLAANEWWYQVNWWRSEGILPCLPIFSMALSCQTSLFEFFDTSNDASLKRMQSVVAGAVHLCSTVYIMVGTLGYIAFHDKSITGNILILLTPSMITEIIKLGFIGTVAISFPLCLFPCRSTLHSLIFKQGFGHHDTNITAIPELRFRILTVSLVIVTIGIAIMLPNIEFVLGIIGSTIGTLICLIFPALMFIHDTSKNTTEKRMAQMLVGIGFFILIACTYSTLQENSSKPEPVLDPVQNLIKVTSEPKIITSSVVANLIQSSSLPTKEEVKPLQKDEIILPHIKESNDQKRLEPPIPQEPEQKEAPPPQEQVPKEPPSQEPEIKADHNADLDPQALQKEDKEIQKENVQPSSSKNIEKQENILRKLEQQHKEQKLILEQQKKVLEELKLHKESHDERRKTETDRQVQPILEVKTEKLPPLVKQQNQVKEDILRKNTLEAVASVPPRNVPVLDANTILAKQEEKKFMPVLNMSRNIPLKNTVLTVQKENIDTQQVNTLKVVEITKDKPLVRNVRNETLHKIKQTVPDINNNLILNPPISEIVRISNPPDPLLKESPKINPEMQEESKISAAHIIKRETLAKEEDVAVSNDGKPVSLHELSIHS